MRLATVFFFVYAGFVFLSLVFPLLAAGGWPDDPGIGIPLCTADGDQVDPTIVADGAGGAIVAWMDSSSGNWDIYAQRVSAAGTAQWTANGVALCTAPGGQYAPTIVSDGAGGAIVTWQDARGNWDIYAQRISAAGAIQWAADGVALCTAAGAEYAPTITADGAGGAIVSWYDSRGGNWDIYAQRISAAGAIQWTADGVALCTATGTQDSPAITSDGEGGAIVTWRDQRGGNSDIYIQRISADGAVQWTPEGVAVCTDTGGQTNPIIASDRAGGAIVTWMDVRNSNWDIYAQRISSAGTVLWAANGVALCTAAGQQWYPTITSDSAGGAIAAWMDIRNSNWDIYTQRISAAGTVQWPANGVALCALAYDQSFPTIVSDGTGGAIVTWHDARSNSSFDIYAEHISAAGTVQWMADGVALCTATGNQFNPTITSDGAGGAIVTWRDYRNGYSDIYAQRVWADGTTPVLLSLVSVDAAADGTTLTWWTGGRECVAATVYRCLGANGWTRIGEVTADGTGYLRYTDHVDCTANRVGYRLGVVNADVESFYGEAWVDLPASEASATFALEPVRPNPTSGSTLTVRFVLASAAPAALELLDAAGRRIAASEVGSLGAGHHAVDLSQGVRLSPGLYLVRLRQDTDVRVTRVAVVD